MAKETTNSFRVLYFFFLLSFLIMGNFLMAQTPNDPPKKIKHLNSVEIQVKPNRFEGNPLAFGNVIFEHEGTELYSDSAVFYQNENLFVAWSNVRMINDTVFMRSDSLRYDGNSSIAKAFGNVYMKDSKSELYSDYAEYNRITDVALASGNVVMLDPNQRIETPLMIYERREGIARTDAGAIIRGDDGTVTHTQILVYNAHSKEVNFDQNTLIETPDYRINSNKMIMNQATDITLFLDYTTITDRKNPRNYIVMPEGGGVFNKKTGEATLNKRSAIYRDGKELWGDNMYFNDQSGFGWAKGDVLINDPEEKRFIRGEYGEVHRNVDSAFVTGQAYAVKAFKEDSLYFHADTLMLVRRTDSTRVIKAYFNARYFKSDAQGKSDSIFYNETKGLMQFYRNPIMWSGEQQITGDTIFAYNDPVKEVMDSVRVFNHAFAISKVDSLNNKDFNQVKGKYMTGYFLNNQLNIVEVHENAQSITFVDDEDTANQTKERIGINLSDCGIIEAEIKGNDVEVLACRIQASSKLYPESKLPPESLYLRDFKWRGDEKMQHWRDIFGDPHLIIKQQKNSSPPNDNNDGKIINLDDFINSSEDSDENPSN